MPLKAILAGGSEANQVVGCRTAAGLISIAAAIAILLPTLAAAGTMHHPQVRQRDDQELQRQRASRAIDDLPVLQVGIRDQDVLFLTLIAPIATMLLIPDRLPHRRD